MKVVFSNEVHKRWKEELDQYGILYLFAMSGYGKTVQAEEFAARKYKEWTRIKTSNQVVEDIDEYLKKIKNGKGKTLLIIDDMQWMREKEVREKFLEKLLWILKNRKSVHCMLLSRAWLPQYLTVLKLTKQLAVEDYESLVLDEEMVAELVEESGLVQKRPDLFVEENLLQNYIIEKCRKVSKGYAIALNAYIERLKEPGKNHITAYELAKGDMYSYFDFHIYQVWDSPHREAMKYLSVCDFFDMELAEIILGGDAKTIIQDMNQIGSFIIEKKENLMMMNPEFLGFLRAKLSQLPEKELSSLYERAGYYYEKHRNILQALECYKNAGMFDRMLNLMCFLSENADGCVFARSCYQYMEELPLEYEERFPKLLAVKAMIYSYHMELGKSDYYLEKLRKKAEEEKYSKIGNEALSNYVRTRIAIPHGTAEKTFDELKFFPEFVKKNGLQVKNVIATGNLPSMINGGLDLLAWGKKYKILYPIMKVGSEAILGKEAIGIADVSVGEHLYELNQFTKSIASLTKGLSEANLKGSIRVQYAATGIMAKLFRADNQWETAYEIMKNILERTQEVSFLELVPNIQASIVELELEKGNMNQVEFWLSTNPADEHEEFFISDRYRLFVKAKAYIAQKRYMEALYIVELLEKYVELFNRTYFKMQLGILRAIILERMGETWKEELLEAAKMCAEYGYVRILADQGVALLALWKELIADEDIKKQLGIKYSTTVLREMKKMADYYPKYLEPHKPFAAVTRKEIKVLRLMAEGMNNQQIALTMNLSVATVKFHVGNILKKLQADNRTSEVFSAKQEGLL